MVSLEAFVKGTKAPKASLAAEQEQTPTLSFADLLKNVGKKDDAMSSGVAILALQDHQEDLVLADTQTDKAKQQDTMQVLSALLSNQPTKNLSELKEEPVLNEQDEKSTTKGLDALKKLLLNKETTEQESFYTLNPEATKDLTTNEVKYLIHKAKQYLKEQITKQVSLTKEEVAALPKTLKGLLDVAKKLSVKIEHITYDKVAKDDVALELKTTQKRSPQEVDLKQQTNNKQTKTKQQQQVQTKTTVKTTQKVQGESLQTFQTKTETLKGVPLFKEVVVTSKQPITTQEIIATKKSSKQTKQTEKNTLLRTLLTNEQKKGVQVKKTEQNLFGVSAKPLPQESVQTQEEQSKNKALEELLKNSETAKPKVVQTQEQNQLQQKIGEAKQMVRYLSQDIKQAIEDYKPPFSRIKVKLNPQKLGEVDLTIVQRGKNVHINLSSNNAALNLLSNNITDLKVQLNQNGIQNASFAFNSQSQEQQKQNEHQKQRQQKHYLHNEEEQQEELPLSLEIVVPRYI